MSKIALSELIVDLRKELLRAQRQGEKLGIRQDRRHPGSRPELGA